jgi:hypothetical protein
MSRSRHSFVEPTVASFDLVLRTSGSLHPDGEPDRFISTHTGWVVCTPDRDRKASKVGMVKAYRIHTDLALQAGESVFDVYDAHSREMQDIYADLLDPLTNGLKESVRGQIDGFDSDVLVLDYVLLSPRWRGLKIGLLAARKLIDLLGGGCCVAVSWVYPLNPDAEEFRGVPDSWIPRHADEAEERDARRKLRRYFRRTGFESIGRTRLDGLSLARVTPTLADLIRPGGG